MSIHTVEISSSDLSSRERAALLPKWRGRRPTISQLLGESGKTAYCCIFTEADLHCGDGRRVHFSDLTGLFAEVSAPRSVQGLQMIRRLQLIEGRAVIPNIVSKALLDAADRSRPGLVSCVYPPDTWVWEVELSDLLGTDDLLEVLPEPFGYYTIIDRGMNWMLRLSDDDPFVLMAGSPSDVSLLETRAPEACIALPGSLEWR